MGINIFGIRESAFANNIVVGIKVGYFRPLIY